MKNITKFKNVRKATKYKSKYINQENQFPESFSKSPLGLPWNEYHEAAYSSALLQHNDHTFLLSVHFRYRKITISVKIAQRLEYVMSS